jgi:fatty acid desaturase
MTTENTWPLRNERYERYSAPADVKRRLTALRPDNFSGFCYIAKDYLVIILAAVLTTRVSWALYPLALLFIGAHQRSLTTIAHDAAHRTLARKKWWNYTLGILFASYPLFQRHWAYRISHVYRHHRFLGDPQNDPDLQFFLKAGVYDVCPPRQYFWRVVLRPILGGASVTYLKYLWSNRFLVGGNSGGGDRTAVLVDKVGFAAFWIIVVAGAVTLGRFEDLILFWVIPYLTTFQILGWFIELAEHSPMCETERVDALLTRNRKGNILERLLFGQNLDEYHLEHHLSPGVPFWRLREAQKIRLQDPRYATVAATWGGLFVPGPNGQKSVIAQLLERNERLYLQSLEAARSVQAL